MDPSLCLRDKNTLVDKSLIMLFRLTSRGLSLHSDCIFLFKRCNSCIHSNYGLIDGILQSFLRRLIQLLLIDFISSSHFCLKRLNFLDYQSWCYYPWSSQPRLASRAWNLTGRERSGNRSIKAAVIFTLTSGPGCLIDAERSQLYIMEVWEWVVNSFERKPPVGVIVVVCGNSS
jgi:hypothetical protein